MTAVMMKALALFLVAQDALSRDYLQVTNRWQIFARGLEKLAGRARRQWDRRPP